MYSSCRGPDDSGDCSIAIPLMLWWCKCINVTTHPDFGSQSGRPKPSETHSSAFPQDSDSESDIEIRSTHSSPETTTSDESYGTLVDTSMSTTPIPSLSGEGDLDSTEGHSQLLNSNSNSHRKSRDS